MEFPGYIRERVQRPIPNGGLVPAGAAPDVSYGNPAKARVATLGLNPGKGHQRDHGRAKGTGGDVATVVDDCYRYFDIYCQEELRWFSKLQRVLSCMSADYCEGSACHLDLVQWPTVQRWSSLRSSSKRDLLKADAPFLREQLDQHQNIKLILACGAGVIEALKHEELYGVEFKSTESLIYYSRRVDRLVTAKVVGIPIIGWRANLQSDHGVYGVTNDGIEELAKQVGKLARDGCGA